MEIIAAAVVAIISALIFVRIFTARQNSHIADLELRLKNRKDTDNLSMKVEQILSEQNKIKTDYERMQEQVARLSDQFEQNLNGLFFKFNEDINNLRREFKNVNLPPESSMSKIDAQKISEETAKKFVEQNLDSKIKTAVEDAVSKSAALNTTPSTQDTDKIISEKITAAIKFVEQNLNSKIKTAVEDAVSKSAALNTTPSTQDTDKIISEKITAAIGAMQNQINLSLQKAFTQVYQKISAVENKIPQTPGAESEYQKKIDDLLKIVPEQNNNINSLTKIIGEQKKIIDQLQKDVEDLKNVRSEVVLKIHDKNSWEEYKNRLQNLSKLKNFSAEHAGNFKWFKIDKVEADIKKLKMPEEFDEYTTGKIVTETVKIFKRLMVALDSCDREIKNPKKNSDAAEELKNLIEEYLQEVGVKTMNFKAGDDYDDWADLGMEGNVLTEPTADEKKHNKLKEIFVQPHFLYFADEHGQKEKRIFGGSCAVYVFE